MFLEKEINSWKEKYNNIIKESKNKENNLNQEIGALKEEIKKLKKEKEKKENINTDKLNNNIQNIRALLENLCSEPYHQKKGKKVIRRIQKERK